MARRTKLMSKLFIFYYLYYIEKINLIKADINIAKVELDYI